MNKKLIPVIVGAGAIGAYYLYKFYGKKQTAKNLNVKLRTIKLQPIQDAAVTMDVANPTNQDIVLNAITADLSINNKAISTLKFFGKKIIAANNSTLIDLKIQLNPMEVISLAADIFKKTGIAGEVTIKGTINAENLLLPFSITQNLKLF